jgi:hypothetical protein
VVEQGTKWVGALWTWDPKKIQGISPHDVLAKLDEEDAVLAGSVSDYREVMSQIPETDRLDYHREL